MRFLRVFALAFAGVAVLCSPARAQNVPITSLPTITTPADNDLAVFEHLTGPVGQRTSSIAFSNIAVYVQSKIGYPALSGAQNRVFATPNGSTGAGSFRAIVGADLPVPSSTTLGGVKSAAAVSHQFLTSIGTDGTPTLAQPSTSDISGLSTSYAGINFAPPWTGYVTETREAKAEQILNGADFGMLSDAQSTGFVNTTKLQAAIDAAYANNATLIIPMGVYFTGPVTFHTGQHIRGAGPGPTQTVLRGTSSYSGTLFTCGNVGSSCDDFYLEDISLDGAWTSGATPSGDLLNVYGLRPTIHNVTLVRAAGIGLHTQSFTGVAAQRLYTLLGHFDHILIDSAKGTGWYDEGPNDSFASHIEVVDASLGTDLGAYGVYLTGNGTLDADNFHVWNRSPTTNRMASSLFVNAGGQKFVNSNFEGGGNAGVYLALGAAYNVFQNCAVFAPTGTVAMIIASGYNRFSGLVGGNINGTNPTWAHYEGIVLGTSSGNKSPSNVLELFDAGADLGAVDFTFSAGGNVVVVRGSKASSTTNYVGTPTATDDVDIRTDGASAIVFRQIASQAAVAWTTFTPTLTATGGASVTFSAQAGAYRIDGKTLYFRANATVSYGTIPTGLTLTLPNSSTSKGATALAGLNSNTGLPFTAYAGASAAAVSLFNGSGGVPLSATGQTVALGGSLEIQ